MEHSRMIRYGLVTLAGLALLPALAAAQQPTRRRQAPIVIRGQVPTPQVVTVRPRAVPAYSRQVLVPRFYNHDFWPEIQESYQLIPNRLLTGNASLDSLSARADSIGTVGVPRVFGDTTARGLAPRSDSTGVRPPADTTRSRAPVPADTARSRGRVPADTGRPPAGTAPARHP